MRLVAWNCNGAFRLKISVLNCLQPDIAIIAEASEKDATELCSAISSSLWVGDDLSRGLAVVPFNGWSVERANVDVDERLFLPCIARLGKMQVQIIAVCAKKSVDYVSPILRALTRLDEFIRSGPTILAGDFNASTAFKRRIPFQLVLDHLDGCNMISAWHKFHLEKFGEETKPTYFKHWSNEPGKTSHIDYVFVPKGFHLTDVQIGTYAEYPGSKFSDHAPLSIDFQVSRH